MIQMKQLYVPFEAGHYCRILTLFYLSDLIRLVCSLPGTSIRTPAGHCARLHLPDSHGEHAPGTTVTKFPCNESIMGKVFAILKDDFGKISRHFLPADTLVRGTDPAPYPDPSIIKQK
jgi:hypothetical protein